MSTFASPNANTVLPCDLCSRTYPTEKIALRGNSNFCHDCATSRPAACLSRLQGSEKNSIFLAVVLAMVSLSIGAAGGWTVASDLAARDQDALLKRTGFKFTPRETPPPAVAAADETTANASQVSDSEKK
jgi:hypothetical protein